MRWFALFVLCAALATAQQKKRATTAQPPAPAVFPLKSVRVEGNHKISAEKIIAFCGLKVGEPVIRTDFDQVRRKLLETGAFESVAYEFKPSSDSKGVDGLIRVIEVDQLFPYRFEDLPASDEALRAALRKQEPILGDVIPGTKEVITRYVDALNAFFEGKVEVTGKMMSDVPGHPAIVFRPPGPRPNIAEVHFEGNDVLPTNLLVKTMAAVAIGVPYNDIAIHQLLDGSIRPLYEARGRIGVTFPKIVTEKASKMEGVGKIEGVSVTVTINEGTSYNLGSVKITGVPAGDIESLQRTANWKTGDIANFDEVRAGMDRITARLKNNGFLHVDAQLDKVVHENEHTVDVVVKINTGPQYMFGKLTIVGLDVLSEPQIRKAWTMAPGKPYHPGYADEFLKGIRNEGVFDNLGDTRAEPKINDKTKIVDVTLYFEGKKQTDKDKEKIGRRPYNDFTP